MKKIFWMFIGVSIMSIGFMMLSPVHADTITFEYNLEFSNGDEPQGPKPWLNSMFTDDIIEPGKVNLTMSTSGLSDGEFVDGWKKNRGKKNGWNKNGGKKKGASIPDASTVFLLGSACLIGLGGVRRKFNT